MRMLPVQSEKSTCLFLRVSEKAMQIFLFRDLWWDLLPTRSKVGSLLPEVCVPYTKHNNNNNPLEESTEGPRQMRADIISSLASQRVLHFKEPAWKPQAKACLYSHCSVPNGKLFRNSSSFSFELISPTKIL